MKTLLATIATAALGLIALPEKAEARPHRGTGHSYTYSIGTTSCGCPIYQRRVVTGYDCYHRPIYRYYSVPVTHRCSSHYRSHHHHGHHHARHHDHHRSHYYHRGHRGHRGHSSVTFRTRYGNVRVCR